MQQVESQVKTQSQYYTLDLWRKCPPLVFFVLTCVISILLYVNNVYLHSRRPEERGEERGTDPPPSLTQNL